MLTVPDIEPHIQAEFDSRLGPLGFQRLGRRRWVRSRNLPIRELFAVGTLKGRQYSPVWGFSCGIVPSFNAQHFRHRSTDKNAIMDLVIDPVDITGSVPPEAFSFIAGHNNAIPEREIRACAEHFVPLALADFARVPTLYGFCQLFLERSRLQYRRFGFDSYVQHQLASGFVRLLMGDRDEGLQLIRAFCQREAANFDDSVLSECIRQAEAHKMMT